MLNSVCAFAICLAASVGSIAVTIATIGLLNININIIDPNTLKVKCIIAALLAFLLAPILEINEVTHVPIFSPYSIGKAAVIGINPWEARAINIPIEALELCTIAVIANPISTPNIGWCPKLNNISVNPWYPANGLTASFMKSIPVNNIPNPISISAIFLCFGLLENIYITIPIPNATGARKSTSSDTNWAVIVVPILAPIITPIAWGKLIIPALTNPTTITVVALLLCITIVTTIPTKTPIITLLVSSSIILLSFDPADFWSPSPIRFIPYKNRPRPPIIPIAISNFLIPPWYAMINLLIFIPIVFYQNFYKFCVKIMLNIINILKSCKTQVKSIFIS